MPTERKNQQIEEIAERLSRARAVVVTDYRGLRVTEIGEVRRRFRDQGIEYLVVKNTLTRFAAERTGREALIQFLKGPTAIAFSYVDEILPAKVVQDFLRANPRTVLKVRGAVLDGRPFDAAGVQRLAQMPPKPILVAQLLGGLQAPASRLAGVLQANLRELANVLDQRRQQLEGPAAEPVPSAE